MHCRRPEESADIIGGVLVFPIFWNNWNNGVESIDSHDLDDLESSAEQ